MPDASAVGLLGRRPAPLRYGNGGSYDPHEAYGIIRSFVPQGARVLDVGCGAGKSTEIATAGKASSVLCLELDPDRAEAARRQGFVVYTDPLDQRFIDAHGAFDAIIFGDVLEHLADPARMISTAKQCLRPGGVIIASVPNVAHWTVRLKLLMGRFDYHDAGIMDATHLRWFTQRTLIELFDRQGFAVTGLGHSAGLWMGVYTSRALKHVPEKLRRMVVLALLKTFPTLMACQHIVCARLRG